MVTTKTSAELKKDAKGQLLGNYGKLVGAFLLMEFVSTGFTMLAGGFVPDSDAAKLIDSLIDLIVLLLSGIFMLGQARMYMELSVGRPVRSSDIFSAFRSHADIGIKIMLVYLGYTLLGMIPFAGMLAIYYASGSALMLPLVSVALVAGMCYAVMQYLSLSQSFYIAIDFPDYGLKQIISLSRRVMKGQRARLFYLYVSFLPLMLLCVLSFFIGFLWIYPYMQGTLTNFYLDLMDYRTKGAVKKLP